MPRKKRSLAEEVDLACEKGWYDHLREKDQFGRFMALTSPDVRRLVHDAERHKAQRK